MNWIDYELAKRCSSLPHLWVFVWHPTGSHTSQGNRGEVPLGPTFPAAAFRGLLLGSGLFSRGRDSGPVRPGAAVTSTGICVSKSAFGPGSMATAGSKSERREEASKGRAVCGPGDHWVWLLAGVSQQVR